MNELLSFAACLSDSVNVRLLMLAQAHKISTAEAAQALKLSPEKAAAHVALLGSAGLVKPGAKHGALRVKRKAQALLDVLFSRFALSAKKDAVLKADSKLARDLRQARHAAEKAARKQAKAKDKQPKDKPKSKTKDKPKAEAKPASKKKQKPAKA